MKALNLYKDKQATVSALGILVGWNKIESAVWNLRWAVVGQIEVQIGDRINDYRLALK